MLVKVKCGKCGNEDLTYKNGKYEWFYCSKCDEMCVVRIVEPSEEKEEKYYWVCWEEITRFGTGFKSDVIKYHPTKFLLKLRERSENMAFTLINWKEISREDYEMWC